MAPRGEPARPTSRPALGADATRAGRLIVSGPGEGAWQMALDEALLESAAASGRSTLRFYEWSEPTLSLGYFQALAERTAHAASRDCPLVRRQTGGGAILHDCELTYSLVFPLAHPLAQDAARLYDAVHRALVRALAERGIEARLNAGGSPHAAADEPFLCFERRAAGDVLLGDFKICGSAQRRRRGAILQHGSLLVARSRKAPSLAGLRELSGNMAEPQDWIEPWRRHLGDELGLRWEEGGLAGAEIECARQLVQQKYGKISWNGRR